MPITPGTKLGPYEIVAPVGAGGMGEVYRARDTRLDRTVAVKVLPQQHSDSAEARQRFDREARAVSSFSHPNICHLYDVGQQDGTSYLVMEYLDGETLADRLVKGPLPIEQALRVGTQICEGLEKAHRSGVVHRDLKPSNIMLTKSGAKLMDFGLAKPAVAAVATGSSSSESLATMSRALTTEGTIVGTFQYMSPEQVEGKDADPRSDIFSFGAVLYEMVTGKRAFEGKTTASTIAAILAAEPKPISAAQPMSPPALEHTINMCLAKDPDERIQTAHDLKVQLRWIAGLGSQTTAPIAFVGRRRRDQIGWLVAGLLLVTSVVCGVAVWWIRAHESLPAMYFLSTFPSPANDVALSRDGRTLAMVAYSDQANKYMIWTQEVGGRGATAIPGTEDAIHPFWSPDGRSIGFFADGKLKRVEVSSGASPQVLCDAPTGRGGTWNSEGVILFAPTVEGGIHRVSAAGGTPAEVTKPEGLQNSHRWPVFLPDGRHFLYLAANFGGEFENNAIFVGSLDSQEKHFVVGASSNAGYADPGYLLYIRDHSLVAQAFDARTFSLSGEPRTLSDEVQYFPQTDLAIFGVAANRTLVLQTGKGADKSQMTWFDRSGKQLGTVGPVGLFANPSLSPDGRRVAFEQTERDGRHLDIWIHETASDSGARLTFGPGLNELPAWSPDGRQIVFASHQKTIWNLMRKNADGSGSEQELAEPTNSPQGSFGWSQDGKYLLRWSGGELWYVTLSDRQAKPLFQGKVIVRNAQFSPDERWIAYSSNETGTSEIYVSPFPNAGNKWQVSRGGGVEPRWRRDGKELFYLSADGNMMAVAVKTGSNFEAATPQILFQAHLRQPISVLDRVSYDVSADGQKFLINTKVDEPNAASPSVILNWTSELEK